MKPRVLFVHGTFEHAHNYSTDLLAVGLAALAEQGLIEYQDNRPKHLSLPEDPNRPGSWAPDPRSRDECLLDSDAAMPEFRLSSGPDLIIGGTHALADLKRSAAGYGKTPVAIIDGFDDTTDFRSKAEDAAPGRICAYFKRELNKGQSWATPLPMTYPERWVPGLWHRDREGVVYYTSVHQGHAMTRMVIADGLRALGEEGGKADVVTIDDRSKRPTPDILHKKLWSALIGIHWNPLGSNSSQHGWDSHRYSENMAHGVLTVAQRPFIEYPDPYVDGEHVIFADDPGHIPDLVKELLDDKERALKIAKAGHRHFLEFHCSSARARYVLKHCGMSVDHG